MTDERTALAEDDPDSLARIRALSSPLRLRILRLCVYHARTNKELAVLLDVNPGTMLHHVRTLVATGFLVAEEERVGAQGAREIPYRSTGLSWRTSMPGGSLVMVETFLQQIAGLEPEQVDTLWLGLKLNDESRQELSRRLGQLAQEFKDRGPDPDGSPFSLFAAIHPDANPDPPSGVTP